MLKLNLELHFIPYSNRLLIHCLDGKENRLAPEGYGYDPDINKFLQLLDGVISNYKTAL